MCRGSRGIAASRHLGSAIKEDIKGNPRRQSVAWFIKTQTMMTNEWKTARQKVNV
jgi:hypothetical protein